LDAYFGAHPYFATQHHIDSFDDFVASRLQAIVRSMNPLTMVREDPVSKILYTARVYVGGDPVLRPEHGVHLGPGTVPASPAAARLGNLTYGAEITADVHVVYTRNGAALEPRDFERVPIGFLPLMVHSSACVLRGLEPLALRARGECPYDMGGYFVIDGREKVIVTQEDRVANRLYMRRLDTTDAAAEGVRVKAFIRCMSADVRDVFPRTTVFRVKVSGEITMTITHLSGGPIPLATVFRALGVETDRDIMHTIFREDVATAAGSVRGDGEEVSFLRPTLIAGHSAGGFSQASAIAFLVPRTRFGTQLDLKGVLLDDLFPNVERTFEAKAIALGSIVRRLVMGALGSEPMADLDDYTNKRLVASGSLVADMFRDAYFQTGAGCLRALNAEFVAGPWRVADDVRTLVNEANLRSVFQPRIVTDALVRALKGSVRDSDDGDGLPVQELTRTSYLGYLSHVRRVNNPVDRAVVPASAHNLRASHWGVLCPVETPDGPNVGLLCHLATLVRLSLGVAESARETQLRPILRSYSRAMRSASDLTTHATDVLLDDTWIAVTDRPSELVAALRSLRRSSPAWRTLGVTWDVWLNAVSVRTDRGRCCRPLRRIPFVGGGSVRGDWSALLASGAVEMIDVEEMATCMVAMNESDVLRSPLNRYTHAEINAAAASLSLVTNTYPLLHHNYGPYTVFCLAQFKQALGVCMTSLRDRFDTLAHQLHHAQRPMIGTSFSDRLFGGALAHGENLVVAIATYSGFNQEDAVILNLDSVQRGRLSLTVYETHRLEESETESDADARKETTLFANPGRLLLRGYSVSAASAAADDAHILRQEAFAHLDERGMPTLDSVLGNGSVLAGMVRVHTGARGQAVKEGPTGDFVDVSERLRLSGAEEDASFSVDGVSFLDAAAASSSTAARSCKIRLRRVRRPELGDKLSSRFGQKGVVGMLLPAADMPFCEADGVVPDLIINPTAFPKRMTVSHILESVMGRRAADMGGRLNADNFGGDIVEEALVGGGLTEVSFTRNGRSGERADSGTSVGINYYGRLKHMVADKLQSRSTGAIDMVTRQPAKSGGQSGGLRIGEMEQNALLAHGLGSFLRESFMQRSDKGGQLIDAASGGGAGWWTHRLDPEVPRDARAVENPYNFQLMQHELAALGIHAALNVRDEDGWCSGAGADGAGADGAGADGADLAM
jgi:DNA-directed RNA polymerase beta subunit